MAETVYHGVFGGYEAPPGAEVFVRALCPCYRSPGRDGNAPPPIVILWPTPDGLGYRAVCKGCGREHTADKGEEGAG